MKLDPDIQRALEAAYADFHSRYHRDRDPVSLVHGYRDPKDRELAGFLAALLSYGNVATILTSVNRILLRLDSSPYQTIVDRKFEKGFEGFRHRFTAGIDIEIICEWLSAALRSHGSLEAFFVGESAPDPVSMKAMLSSFVRRLERGALSPRLTQQLPYRARSLKYLLSDPERGSACKRLNMYLRWVTRPDDGIDLGLWNRVSTRDLMLPVDTHLLKTLRLLKWTRSKAATWKVVEAATARLRLYHPTDPIRYDFALCHLSMTGRSLKAYATPKLER